MKQIVAFRELFEPIPIHKVSKTNQTSYYPVVHHHVPIGHNFDLVELLDTKAFVDQEKSVFVEELNGLLSALKFLLYVCESVLVDLLVHPVAV